jgi:hypothetical protein
MEARTPAPRALAALDSAVTGFLTCEQRGCVTHTRITIGLDCGYMAERSEGIRIDDHLLDGYPLRDKLRELAPNRRGSNPTGWIVRVAPKKGIAAGPVR